MHDAHADDPTTAFAISRLTDAGYLNQRADRHLPPGRAADVRRPGPRPDRHRPRRPPGRHRTERLAGADQRRRHLDRRLSARRGPTREGAPLTRPGPRPRRWTATRRRSARPGSRTCRSHRPWGPRPSSTCRSWVRRSGCANGPSRRVLDLPGSMRSPSCRALVDLDVPVVPPGIDVPLEDQPALGVAEHLVVHRAARQVRDPAADRGPGGASPGKARGRQEEGQTAKAARSTVRKVPQRLTAGRRMPARWAIPRGPSSKPPTCLRHRPTPYARAVS